MSNPNGWGDGSVNNNIGWGQGANNNTGWGKSHLSSWNGLTDIDGGDLPTNSIAPAITGTAQEGQTLTCSTGTWSGLPTYAYQWKRNGNNIGGATSSTYLVALADVGQNILCTVTATNFVGSATANSNTVTPTSSVDADAQAFITAAGITDPTQQAAINQLVVDLKGYSIWTKMKAIYPFVGGTATQHKWNLKDPRDLDVAFRLVFSGGWTHSSTGATPNGTNATADTKLNASSNLSQNSTHISFYSRTLSGSNLVPTMASSGYAVTGGTRLSLNFASQTYFGVNTLYQDGVSNTNTSGFFIANRIASATHSLMIRGTRTDISQASDGVVNQTFRIGGSPAGHYDNKEAAFASIGDGLTNTDMTNLTIVVQTFNTALARQV